MVKGKGEIPHSLSGQDPADTWLQLQVLALVNPLVAGCRVSQRAGSAAGCLIALQVEWFPPQFPHRFPVTSSPAGSSQSSTSTPHTAFKPVRDCCGTRSGQKRPLAAPHHLG